MKNRIVESLGKNNKSFLRTTFGFKTMSQAKKALGATTTREAYDIMKELFNEKIEEERNERNKMNKTKRNFLKVMRELNKRKKQYNVAITIDERKTYHKNERVYTTSTLVEKSYLVRNDTELESKINEDITSQYPYEDSDATIELVAYQYNISLEKIHKMSPLDVPMKRSKPLMASFLQYGDKIDPISYEDHNGECVLKTLLKYMDIKKEKTLVKYFDEASKELYGKSYHKNNGITSRMILHLCQKRNISCLGFDQKNRNFVKHTADRNFKRKFRPIIFYMFLSHFYLITDEKTVVSISQTFRQNNNVFHSTLEIPEEHGSKKTEFYTNLSMDQVLEFAQRKVIGDDGKIAVNPVVVIYDKNDLNEELRQYIERRGSVPKVSNKSITQVGKIVCTGMTQLVLSGCLGEGLEWQSIQNICEKAEVKFDNQSLGKLLCQLQNKFFVVKRAKFTPELRESIKVAQTSKCVICKEVLADKFHIDHIQPLANGGTNDKNNLQALCQSCHIDKSREEKDACEYIQNDNITSAFNIQAMEAIESKFFRKVAFTQKLVNYEVFDDSYKQSFDMVKCRRNILLHYGEQFCRYSVLDDIENFDGKLTTGFYYVETYNDFPMRQNGFYSLPMVKYCLEQNIITLEDIKYQLKPSFKIDSDYFKSFVEHLDDLFKGDDFLKKLSVNSLVGLFGRRKNTFVENMLCHSDEIEDIACAYQEFHKPYLNVINEDVVQVSGQGEVKKIESAFPIHAQILECEAIELHKLVNMIREHGGTPYEVKTDAVNYYNSYPLDIGEHYWDSEETIKKYKSEEAKDMVRAVVLENVENFELSGSYYKKYAEDSDYTKLAKMLVDSEKGCLILGPAGTGKTFLINEIKKHLEDKELRYKCLAPTNKATLLMNGETLHKFSYALLNSKKQLKKYKNIDYIMVDEISMVQEIFYQVLLILKNYNPNLKMFIVGDFGQLPPVNDKVNKNYEKTRALFELVDGNKLELTQCKRSDNSHFNTCMKVRKGIPIDLKPFQQKEKTYLNVCFTNELRKKINSECSERFLKEFKPTKIIKYEALKYDKNSQDMTICKDMPVIARVNNKSLGVINNEVFSIDKIDDEFIIVSNELKENKQIPVNQFNKIFYLAFCITIHKSQGTTFDKKYTIHEWSKQNRKLKYVAISRATDAKNIQIVL